MPNTTLTLKSAASEKRNRQDYFNIAVSVDCVILGYENKELKVLLIEDPDATSDYITMGVGVG